MGASDWSYFTPYTPNPNLALLALHRQEEATHGKPQMEILDEAGEDMTHSILDIFTLTDAPYDQRSPMDFLIAFAMPQSWLQQIYGTLRPSRKTIEAAEREGPEPFATLERGTAVYCPVWPSDNDPGDPQWWYFYGCTGD